MQAGSPPSIPGGATLVFDVELISVQSANGTSGVSSNGVAGQSYWAMGSTDSNSVSGWLLPSPPATAVVPDLFRKKVNVGEQQPSGVVVVCPCAQQVKPENLIAAGISPLWCRATDEYNVHHFVQPRF